MIFEGNVNVLRSTTGNFPMTAPCPACKQKDAEIERLSGENNLLRDGIRSIASEKHDPVITALEEWVRRIAREEIENA